MAWGYPLLTAVPSTSQGEERGTTSTLANDQRRDTSISVLLSVYRDSDPDDVDRALESAYTQSVAPTEVVIVKDGPLPGPLCEVLSKWADRYSGCTTIVALAENRGLGEALSVGTDYCSGEWIARVDADDINCPGRFEKQIEFIRSEDPPLPAVVGGYMRERGPNGETAVREVPTDPEDVYEYARYRSPVNHPTAMIRRSALEAVGGYRDLRSMQDYDLWVRLLDAGYTIANIPEVLVETDVGDDGESLYCRRGGLEYAAIEYSLQREFLRRGFISPLVFLVNLCIRIPIRLLPTRIRKHIYTTFLRGEL